MCGIYGMVGKLNSLNVLNALEKLEYRGYDSCGIAYTSNNKIYMYKTVGNTLGLKKKVPACAITSAIGHTRWATHGIVNEKNAHPHYSNKNNFYIVHNGVIDNYLELKEKYSFKCISDTDSEIIVHLLDMYTKKYSILDSLKMICLELNGSFAVVIIEAKTGDLYFIKNKSPLLIGAKNNKIEISSDQCVFDEEAEITILNDYNYGSIVNSKVNIYSAINDQNILNTFKKRKENNLVKLNEHYMLDEMYYEINMIMDIASKYKYINNLDFLNSLNAADEICFIGAGSSFYAGCILSDYYQKKIKKRCLNIIASEFYSFNLLCNNTVFIILSQSGETADLCDIMPFLNNNYKTILLCNNVNSSLSYMSDMVFPLYANPEISVASTKAFTAMIYVGMILLDGVSNYASLKISESLRNVFLKWDKIYSLAIEVAKSNLVIYLGKGIDYSLSMEAALKLREISYLHSFAFPAGELKHGSIALVDNKTICIGIVTENNSLKDVKNNLEEVRCRGAKAYLISNCDKNSDFFVEGEILPIVLFIQILAYQASYILKRNIDQPRHLAKSVTVK